MPSPKARLRREHTAMLEVLEYIAELAKHHRKDKHGLDYTLIEAAARAVLATIDGTTDTPGQEGEDNAERAHFGEL